MSRFAFGPILNRRQGHFAPRDPRLAPRISRIDARWILRAALAAALSLLVFPGRAAAVSLAASGVPREALRADADADYESRRIEERNLWYLQHHGDRARIDPERQRLRVAAEYARSRAEAKSSALKPQGVGGTEWISLGPTNGAGRMTAIAPVAGMPGTAYAGSAGGGVWKTADGGATWASLTDARNTGLVTRQFYALANDSSNRDRVIAGSQDNGTVQRIGTGTVWRYLQGGDGGEAAVHPLVPSTAPTPPAGSRASRTPRHSEN